MKGIILSGKSGSGKDAIAKVLVDSYGFTRYSFADAVKEYCSKKYLYPLEWNYSQEGKNRMMKIDNPSGNLFRGTIRDLLMEVGLQKRYEDPSYWVTQTLNKIRTENPNKIVITDCRYENEVAMFSYLGLMTTRVNADRESRLSRVKSEKQVDSKHVSEIDLDEFDFDKVIDNSNDKKIEEVAYNVYKAYEEYKNTKKE